MQRTISYINSLHSTSLLCFGVGVGSSFYNVLKAEKKIGVDKFDPSLYPRLWTAPTKGKDIKKTVPKKGEYDVIVINDSKHFKDLEGYFNKALEVLSEGGKIILTHSLPNRPYLVDHNYKPFQTWCGDVYEFVLKLKSQGGYKIESFEYDYGVTVVEIDEKVKGEEIEFRPFEEWYFDRKKLMNIND